MALSNLEDGSHMNAIHCVLSEQVANEHNLEHNRKWIMCLAEDNFLALTKSDKLYPWHKKNTKSI